MCCGTMTWFFRISIIITVIIAVYFGLSYDSYNIPQFDFDEYWGPGVKENYKRDKQIRRFKIEYPNQLIDNLNRKLSENYTFVLPLEDAASSCEYGINSSSIATLVKYWRDSYLPKWDERLKYFNSFPNYMVEVQG